MKLFLSSYRFGEYADVFQDMVGENTKLAMITNAKDYKTPQDRAKSVQECATSFTDLGIHPHEIDLRIFFGQADFLRKELEKYTAVWLCGGNTFILARALRESGADEIIISMVCNDQLIYGGESAGSVVAGPTLQGVEFSDDPDILPAGYQSQDVWKGLDLVPYSIVPHYDSGNEGCDRMIDVLEQDGLSYKMLNDSQVIVVDGEKEMLLS